MGCPCAQDMYKYVEGKLLKPKKVKKIEAHFPTCEACKKTLQSIHEVLEIGRNVQRELIKFEELRKKQGESST